MAQGHGDRLSGLDTAFLELETPTQHMHVGGVFLFRPGPDSTFTFEHFQRLVRSRMHRVPRYRQKLAWPPLGMAHPMWVDDPNFDLAYHVRHAALPRPGGQDQLLEYAGRILSRQLDRQRPLWELYVVEGLENGDIAIIGKNHHAMIDGMAGVDITAILLDTEVLGPDDITRPQPWDPLPTPSSLSQVSSVVRGVASSPSEMAMVAKGVVDAPLDVAAKAVAVGRGLVSTTSSLLGLAPRSVLNQAPGISRRMAIQRIELDRIKKIKNAFGTTVNDVVLATVGDALGRYLRHRHQVTTNVELRAMVPVSVRSGDPTAHGNQVTSVFVDLPVGEMDPVARLRTISERMGNVKASHSAVGADFLLNLAGFAPPTLHALGARAASQTRLYNVLVTNVPGPQVPLFTLGARLVGAHPFVPLAATQSLGIGLISLDGMVHIGLTADYDALPDVSIIPDLLAGAAGDLEACALALHS
ncbi:MAG TPA: wax ester/triacylglycerol synthase family O-acyltransferase [Nitriliruptoraceae bacterium]|nr:wax ester/triacylglycerol synthase family O-acyltransferase [Nitriliruptoraceae bacterium]